MKESEYWNGRQDDPITLLEKLALEDQQLMNALTTDTTTRYICMRCETPSPPRYSTYLTIPLVPPEGWIPRNHTIQELIATQYHGVIVDRACGECPGATSESHRTSVNPSSQALLITLGRNTGGNIKNTTAVELSDTIQLGESTYFLLATTTHMGSTTEAGHWTTWTKQQNTWTLYDDEATSITQRPDTNYMATSWSTALFGFHYPKDTPNCS